jgi:VanZ family protein
MLHCFTAHDLSAHRRLVGRLLAIYTLALVLGTHLPAEALGDFSQSDKSLHFVAYTLLAALVFAYFTARWGHSRRNYVGIVVGIAAFAAIDEYTQRYIPGRSPDIVDWWVDNLGVAVAAAGSFVMQVKQIGRLDNH